MEDLEKNQIKLENTMECDNSQLNLLSPYQDGKRSQSANSLSRESGRSLEAGRAIFYTIDNRNVS